MDALTHITLAPLRATTPSFRLFLLIHPGLFHCPLRDRLLVEPFAVSRFSIGKRREDFVRGGDRAEAQRRRNLGGRQDHAGRVLARMSESARRSAQRGASKPRKKGHPQAAYKRSRVNLNSQSWAGVSRPGGCGQPVDNLPSWDESLYNESRKVPGAVESQPRARLSWVRGRGAGGEGGVRSAVGENPCLIRIRSKNAPRRSS